METVSRATESPLAYLRPLNVSTDRRRDRRASSVDEVRRLLTAAHLGAESYGEPMEPELPVPDSKSA